MFMGFGLGIALFPLLIISFSVEFFGGSLYGGLGYQIHMDCIGTFLIVRPYESIE